MRKLWMIPLAILGGGLAVATYLGMLQVTGNFHTVVPGQLYRSAQPSPSDIALYRRDYGIRTIVNLRGRENAPWYAAEIDASRQAGIVHVDFPMSSSRLLTTDEMHHLTSLLRDAPKPVLIHCRAGADRTGLASVIYLQQIAGENEAVAERQLSLAYGHIGIPVLSPAFAMDESWESFEKTLGIES